MTVDQIAREEVVTATREDGAAAIAERMAEADVGAVVITEGDEPAGIVTDRQIATTVGADGTVADLDATDLMTADPVTVGTDAAPFELVQTFSDAGVRRLPVVDGDGALAGIVSLDDLLVLLANEFADVGDVLEAQSPRF
ncbi:CBS domain-containing protein [Natronoarchaeum rubrum]|uniref:CBS domain-containing protein n=1 Tax=Natronoarchaeum rubrum TaxID=755311 RepID=UPI0021110ED4|nr:CBS domain-containing protein [Natronoarchaeum rubrum]HMB49632.1 CBS domain-containing protein [Natronoarchaeum rubrum]